MTTIRLFMIVEAASFLIAALIHSGVLTAGYEHRAAAIAANVIALALVAGLAWSWIRPAATRTAGIAAQGFALLGTVVGLLTIVIGVGPRTAPDIAYHVAILFVLAAGLAIALRTDKRPANVRPAGGAS